MKAIKNIFIMALGALALTSCEQDFCLPPIVEPKYEGVDANTTIADLKKLAGTTISKGNNEATDLVLEATVTANDNSGNVYKKLYIQDKTGGMYIGVDATNLSTIYHTGQKVFISLDGLSVNKKYEDYSLVASNENFITKEILEKIVKKDGWPDEEFKPEVVTVADLNKNEEANINKYVEFEDVYFEGAGIEQFAVKGDPGFASTRTAYDKNGVKILVRTSIYSKMANAKLPVGRGKLRGIVSKFKSDWQITLFNGDAKENYGYFDFDKIPVVKEDKQPEQPVQPEKPEQPEQPEKSDAKKITIAEVKALAAGTDLKTPNSFKEIVDDVFVEAVVTGDDKMSNLYKQIIIQDATGSLIVTIDMKKINTLFAIGDKVKVNLKGLGLSEYGGLLQLGKKINDKTFIPEADAKTAITKVGTENVVAKVFEDLESFKQNEANLCEFVEMKNVTFTNGGKENFYMNPTNDKKYYNHNQDVTDSKGNVFVVRTSKFSPIKDTKLPEGKVNIKGIMTKHVNKEGQTTYQLFIVTENYL